MRTMSMRGRSAGRMGSGAYLQETKGERGRWGRLVRLLARTAAAHGGD